MLSLNRTLRGLGPLLVLSSMAIGAANAQHATEYSLSDAEDAMWPSPEHHLPRREIQEPIDGGHSSHHHSAIDHDASAHQIGESGSSDGMEPTSSCNCSNHKCRGLCRDPGHPEKPKREQPGDINRGDCPPVRYRMSDFSRAGKPTCVHRFAKCSVDDSYSAWFVGGGAAFFKGRPRKSSEGTWGLDYDGLFGKANHWLNYTRCREQGGEGAYATDGEPEFVSRVHGFLGLGH